MVCCLLDPFERDELRKVDRDKAGGAVSGSRKPPDSKRGGSYLKVTRLRHPLQHTLKVR